MAEVTLSSKNQIVIPREVREALDLKPGDKLIVTTCGERILILKRPKSYHRAIRGLMSYPKNYVQRERESWE